MKTLEQLMELADEYANALTAKLTGQEINQARAALHAALVEVTEALDIQAGSIEAVQSANQRLAAENKRLRDALTGVYNSVGQGGSAYDIYQRVRPMVSAALGETK